MNLQVLLVWGIQSTFMLLAALLACAFLQKSPAARVLVSRSALVGTLALLVGAPWLHQRSKPVVPINLAPIHVDAMVMNAHVISLEPAIKVPKPIDGAPNSVGGKVERPEFSPILTVGAVYLGGLAVFGLLLLAGYIRLAATHKRCRKVIDGAILDAVRVACSAFSIPTPKVRAGPDITVPFVAGVWRPTLYLPQDWVDIHDQETLGAICRHEMAHVAAKDLPWSIAYRISTVVFWFQPLVWIFKRQSEAACEELCDQKVLSSGCSPEWYASALLELRESLIGMPKATPVGIGAVAIRSSFGKRIEAIMNQKGMFGKGLSRPAIAGLVLTSVGITALGATLFAVPKQAESKISVRVLTPDGKPVEGVGGLAITTAVGQQEFIRAPIHSGRLEVSWLKKPDTILMTLVATAPGYGLSFRRLQVVNGPIEALRLNPETSLTTQVFLPDGKPAVGLRVCVTQLSKQPLDRLLNGLLAFPKDLQQFESSTTDSNGRFELKGLPKGYRVNVDVDDSRFSQVEGPVLPLRPIRLSFGSVFEGRVTRNGNPMAGIVVRAQGNLAVDKKYGGLWAEAVTDPDGRYRIDRLNEAHYNIALQLKHSLFRTVTAVAHEDVEIGQGESKTGLDFDLIPGSLIKGVVTGPDGVPMPQTMVIISGPAFPSSSAWAQGVRTDKDGRFVLRVPAGQQRISVADKIKTVKTIDGQEATVNFVVN